MTDGQEPVLDFIIKYWVLIGLVVGQGVVYIELKFRVRNHVEKFTAVNKRIDTLESHLRDDLREMRTDIKKLLARGE